MDPRLGFHHRFLWQRAGRGRARRLAVGEPPGRVIFEGLATQQAYDWNETHAAKPLHNVALVDRLRSYASEAQDVGAARQLPVLYGREAWQRAVALALTRGVQGLGHELSRATPTATARGPEVVAWQTEMHAWMRQIRRRLCAHGADADDRHFFRPSSGRAAAHRAAARIPKPEELYAGSHEGKVTEALFLCHAAGWPARVITYQEMMRGPLPASMKAILLVGLDQPDETWNWSPGLEPKFEEFVDRGGRILLDDESVSPVPATATGLQVAAYVAQANVDATPLLFARNAENIAKLRAAMQGVAPPVAVSDSPALWAIPGGVRRHAIRHRDQPGLCRRRRSGRDAAARRPARDQAGAVENQRQRQPLREAADRHAAVEHGAPDLRRAPRPQADAGGGGAGAI